MTSRRHLLFYFLLEHGVKCARASLECLPLRTIWVLQIYLQYPNVQKSNCPTSLPIAEVNSSLGDAVLIPAKMFLSVFSRMRSDGKSKHQRNKKTYKIAVFTIIFQNLLQSCKNIRVKTKSSNFIDEINPPATDLKFDYFSKSCDRVE